MKVAARSVFIYIVKRFIIAELISEIRGIWKSLLLLKFWPFEKLLNMRFFHIIKYKTRPFSGWLGQLSS